MKQFRTSLLCVCICMAGLNATAQSSDAPPMREPDNNKPKLFTAYPDLVPVDITVISSLLNNTVGAAVDKNIGAGTSFRLSGEVVSVASKYDNRINSVVIRSANFGGARLSFTRTILEDGSITYTGRLISKQHGDVYELQTINNKFALVKRNYYDLVNE
jgi:hypothetical protein